jgi:hypothetical protein
MAKKTRPGVLGLPQIPYGEFVSYDIQATTPGVVVSAQLTTVTRGNITKGRTTALGVLGLPQVLFGQLSPDKIITATTETIAVTPIQPTVLAPNNLFITVIPGGSPVIVTPIDVIVSKDNSITATTPAVKVTRVPIEIINLTRTRVTRNGLLGFPQIPYRNSFAKGGVSVGPITKTIVVTPIDTTVSGLQDDSINATTGTVVVTTQSPVIKTNEVATGWFNDSWWSAPFWHSRTDQSGWWTAISNVSVSTGSIKVTPYKTSILTAFSEVVATLGIKVTPIDVSLDAQTSITATTPNVAVTANKTVVSSTPALVLPNTPSITVTAVQPLALGNTNVFATTPGVVVSKLDAEVNAEISVTTNTTSIKVTPIQTSVNGSESIVSTTETIVVTPIDATINASIAPVATTGSVAVTPVLTVVGVSKIANATTEFIKVTPINAVITSASGLNVFAGTPNISVSANDPETTYLWRFGIIVSNEQGSTGSIVNGE